MIYTLAKLSWGYPLPLMPWLLLGLCRPCPGGVRGGKHRVSSPHGWPYPLHGTHQSAGSSRASASPAGSAARQAHGEEGQRDRQGFSIINHPSKAFQRMVSESPSQLSFPQERRREVTNHLRGMCLTDRRSLCCWQLQLQFWNQYSLRSLESHDKSLVNENLS